ncbi:MAG: phycobiliprotein lyase [Cyanobium sp.]
MNDFSGDQPPFPPADLPQFLRHCAGEWMSLRSQFDLGPISASDQHTDVSATDEQGDGWHTSERGELVVAFLEADGNGGPGGLRFGHKDGGAPRQLSFDADGGFRSGDQQGRWQLWPDGSLELTVEGPNASVHERIWFTKPNLRLRSSVEHRPDGSPGRASFSSEIRRVSRPTPSAPSAVAQSASTQSATAPSANKVSSSP